jgi:2-dehydropantoate 2-reductase
MQKQRYAVIGTGALGGLYGAMLARSGCDVHFLLNSDFDHVAEHGLKIDSHYGDFELPSVNAHSTVETMPACDVTIVALKTTNNKLLHSVLPAPTREGGIVLVLQNGLDIEAESAAVVGTERTLGGAAFLCSNKVGPGHIRHLDHGRIVFGNYVGPLSDQARRIGEEMAAAGIDVQLTDNLLQTRWRKLMWNIPFNGLGVVLDVSTKQMIESEDAVALIRSIIVEVHQAATASGVEIAKSLIEKTIDTTRTMVPYDSSMRLDYLNRRPMEIEAIFGNPLRAARKVGVDMPRVEMLYRELKFIEAIRLGELGAKKGR